MLSRPHNKNWINMENQKTNNTYKHLKKTKHSYKKPYLKYQLALSLQRVKKVSYS